MAEDLVGLALTDPERAMGLADLLLRSPLPAERARGHQAMAICLRDAGRLLEALPHLDSAVRAARRAGDLALQADVLGTSGGTLVFAGQVARGLRQLDASIDLDPSARALMRRAYARVLQGRYEDADRDNRRARELFRRDGETAWEARVVHNLGWSALARGRLDLAENLTREAERMFASTGLDHEATMAHQNLGEVRVTRGDLAGGLRIFDEVALRYDRVPPPHLATVRARTMLAAGLLSEAVQVTQEALARGDADAVDAARLQLVQAQARLARGELSEAREAGGEAARTAAGRDDIWVATRARLVALQAAVRSGMADPPTVREARLVAEELDRSGGEEAPAAMLIAATLDPAAAKELLDRAARYRRAPSDLARASAWLARARSAESEADRGGVLRACGRGLAALDDRRRLLGSTELRALATAHGTELAELALRHAASRPRDLLAWSERWRSTALAQPPVTPGDAPVLESLAALRDVVRRLGEARAGGAATEELERDRARLERQVRAEHHRQSGSDAAEERFAVDEIVPGVDDGALVELVEVDGALHVLVVHQGRVRRKVAGVADEAVGLAESARFLLRRAARGRPFAPGDLGQRLQRILFGDAAQMIPDGPVVVVPTARLHGVPWALLPTLADRPFSIAPSAGQWLRASRAPIPTDGQVALLTGPGLGTGGAEVPVLAKRYPDSVHLSSDGATVEAAMAALDGARLAHIAAHGRFRADSPLFSALEMADGPLTVHDLERLKRAPHRVVLSACESGVLAPVGAEELLGLASALFALGTAGMVTSVAEVNDVATARLMVDLHARLAQGDDPAHALAGVRRAAEDPLDVATAVSFVALGA